jgi:hypothetical protein
MNNKDNDYTDDFNQYLSFVDLEKDPEWNTAWRAQDEEKVEGLLYKYGADVKFGFEVEVVLHRPRCSNQAEYGPKINFVQRTDAAWLPYLSTEDLIATTSDVFMRSELMTMNRRSNFSGDLIDKYGEAGDEI